ncbi:hypothetical protein [Streptomyces jumonjinensis]|uniref:Uncharacterized protein n=1 Tax=Streptomyces jumonjinensis TaxID=1945 RepID=A0A646KLI9_STRJU|nr:hypothetical protein [Streptomyces jumonjinensis]MQT03075.1 hypothetical protein [Streptomyces jumonjinensis]
MTTSGLRRPARAGAVAAATALSFALATPSHADGAMAYAAGGAGKGYFTSYGDYFSIMDTAADGHSAVIHWKSSSGRESDEWDIDGADNGWTVVNRNLPEEDTVQYRACWGEWGNQYIHQDSCSSWVTTSAG